MTAIRIVVNGEERRYATRVSVHDVVAELAPDAASGRGPARGVAAAVNESVLPRSAWASTTLRAGDRLEIVKAVQGG